MAIRLHLLTFCMIGLVIGLVLAMQLRSVPIVSSGTLSQDVQIENKMLAAMTEEHRDLTVKMTEVQQRRFQLEDAFEKNTSRSQQKLLKELRAKANYNLIQGEGIRITIEDGFSIGGTYFQASDLRDLVNALYLQGAAAIKVNGYRITVLTTLHEAFDTLFIDNHQISSPFIIEAVGNPEALSFVLKDLRQKKLKIFFEESHSLQISPLESMPTLIYTSLSD